MKKVTVLKFFKNKPTEVARMCGIDVAAVCQWGEIIPEKRAFQLERHTNGKLKYNPKLYQKKPNKNQAA